MKQFVIPFLVMCCAVKAQKPSHALLEQTVENYKHHRSMSYTVDNKIKTFDDTDTISIHSACKLFRVPTDTIFGGQIAYTNKSNGLNVQKIYDLKKLYLLDYNTKKITSFDPSKGEVFPIRSSIDGEVINIGFLNPSRLLSAVSDKANRVTISDTTNGMTRYTCFTVRFPDEDDIKGQVKKIYVNKKTKTIERLSFFVRLDDQWQYNEWQLKDVVFDQVASKSFEDEIRATNYPVEVYVPQELKSKPENLYLQKAHDFTAIDPITDQQFNLDPQKARLTILDFWYMACYPCLKAMPKLEVLYQKYRSKGLEVIGVDAIDNNTKQKQKLPAFLKNRKINYKIALVDQKTLDAYQVTQFPTIIMIDTNGIIQTTSVGYGDGFEKELESKIDQLLNIK